MKLQKITIDDVSYNLLTDEQLEEVKLKAELEAYHSFITSNVSAHTISEDEFWKRIDRKYDL